MSDLFRFSESCVQDGSPFFTKFPPEIRRLIYREAFGDRRVHIVSKETQATVATFYYHTPQKDVSTPAPRRWTHHVCVRNIPDYCDVSHPHYEDKDKSCHLATQILRTCKQAFEEGIHLLYTSNVFAFDGGHNVSHFQDTFHSADLIRSIEVYSNTMVLGDDDVRLMTGELDAITETLEKRKTPVELRINFSIKQSPGYRPWEGERKDHERRMGSLVACFVAEFIDVFLGVDRCRLELDVHQKLRDGRRETLERVVPTGLRLPPTEVTWFCYDDEEIEESGEETED